MGTIYRVVSQSEWEASVLAGSHAGGELDLRDGFIHCSAAHQLAGTLAKHHAGRTDLVLLHVDDNALAPAALRWEPSRGGEDFPHVFGALPIGAVLFSEALRLDMNGVHELPALDAARESARASDAVFMRQAIALALGNVGHTGQNPSVGCVVVRAEQVIASAATAHGGRPHAEEQALHGLTPVDLAAAVVYVTLEPCGERSSGAPSCSALLTRGRPRRVVVACEDPSPYAAGRGIERLRGAKIPVELGLLGGAAAHVLYASYVARLRGL